MGYGNSPNDPLPLTGVESPWVWVCVVVLLVACGWCLHLASRP